MAQKGRAGEHAFSSICASVYVGETERIGSMRDGLRPLIRSERSVDTFRGGHRYVPKWGVDTS